MNAQTDDMNDKWLNDLRDRMADYREPAPEDLWDDIARELDRASVPAVPAAPVVPPRNVVALWMRRAAVAAMLALALALGYTRLSRDAAPAPDLLPDLLTEVTGADMAEESALAVAAHDVPKVGISGKRVAASARGKVRTQTETAESVLAAKRATTFAAQQAESADGVSSALESSVESNAESSVGNSAESRAETAAEARKGYAATGGRRIPTADSRHAAKRTAGSARGRLTADVYLSGLAAGASDSQHSVSGAMMVSADRYRSEAGMVDPLDDPLTVVMLYNRNAPVDTEIRHRQPLRFGFSLRCMITHAIGIESGLTYTLLRSDISSGGAECYYDEDRTLHYMGIPVNLVWNAWSGKRLTFYLSGGASVEKCVSGHSETRYVLRGRGESTERRSMEIKPLQWSVAAAAGLQYNLSPRTGLYVEPGIGYYFDNGSETETAYSKRPLNFNLNLGIRISFR